jgi:hypothetical protein
VIRLVWSEMMKWPGHIKIIWFGDSAPTWAPRVYVCARGHRTNFRPEERGLID